MSTAADIVDRVIRRANIESTKTKAGWCLREGLLHVGALENGSLLHLIDTHGVPAFYSNCKTSSACRHDATQDLKDPSNCFESLCRIVVGQFVSGKAAQAAWRRLLSVTQPALTPETVLRLGSDDIETKLRVPAGLTKSKALCLVDLATHFHTGTLSEDFLQSGDVEEVRKALLMVKGIGPWSCDMFLQFYLEHSNILAIGDLGIRKGLQRHFKSTQKDLKQRFSEYQPYQSLLAYYMWRVADTKISQSESQPKKKQKRPEESIVVQSPSKRRRTSPRRTVTPER